MKAESKIERTQLQPFPLLFSGGDPKADRMFSRGKRNTLSARPEVGQTLVVDSPDDDKRLPVNRRPDPVRLRFRRRMAEIRKQFHGPRFVQFKCENRFGVFRFKVDCLPVEGIGIPDDSAPAEFCIVRTEEDPLFPLRIVHLVPDGAPDLLQRLRRRENASVRRIAQLQNKIPGFFPGSDQNDRGELPLKTGDRTGQGASFCIQNTDPRQVLVPEELRDRELFFSHLRDQQIKRKSNERALPVQAQTEFRRFRRGFRFIADHRGRDRKNSRDNRGSRNGADGHIADPSRLFEFQRAGVEADRSVRIGPRPGQSSLGNPFADIGPLPEIFPGHQRKLFRPSVGEADPDIRRVVPFFRPGASGHQRNPVADPVHRKREAGRTERRMDGFQNHAVPAVVCGGIRHEEGNLHRGVKSGGEGAEIFAGPLVGPSAFSVSGLLVDAAHVRGPCQRERGVFVPLVERRKNSVVPIEKAHGDRAVLLNRNHKGNRSEVPCRQTGVSRSGFPGIVQDASRRRPGFRNPVEAEPGFALFGTAVADRFPVHGDLVEQTGFCHVFPVLLDGSGFQFKFQTSAFFRCDGETSPRPLFGTGKENQRHFVRVDADPCGVRFPDSRLVFKRKWNRTARMPDHDHRFRIRSRKNKQGEKKEK